MSDRIRIKICGVRTPDIAEAALDAGADMVGVVFVERSPRYVTVEQAAAVSQAVAGRAQVVGLSKDHSLDEVRCLVDAASLTMLQLHGAVDGKQVDTADLPVRYLATQPFDPATFADRLEQHEARFAASQRMAGLIIDTPDPTKIGGGTGKSFDWSALRRMLDDACVRVPIILAGGLTPDNVADAIRAVRPWAVDVSSGVESSRGVKDVSLIRAFCEAARNA